MNVYDSSRIRNVVLLGHSGSGKTTFAETMLFESGMINKRGTVEQKNTVSDYHEIEKEKGKSVISSFMLLDWRGNKINLIDTPGTTDYVGEVLGALRVADTAVYTLNAEHGVEVGTEMLWKHTQKFNIPTILVANKLDNSKSNFQKTVDMAKERFGRNVVVVQYPYSEGDDFHAIIDVLKMTMYEFPENGGKPDKLPIPESQRSQAELLHNELVEAVAENDELLMDIYFEKGELDESHMREGLQKALLNQDIYPLFCCSSARNMGSGRIMGFLGNVAPSPVEANPPLTTDGEKFVMDADGETTAFLFKTHAESHVGDLVYFKVYSGSVKTGMDLINESTGNTVRLPSVFLTEGAKRIEVQEIKTGDIGAVVKLKEGNVNDTLHAKDYDIALEPIHFPKPTVRTAVALEHEGEEDKLGEALNQLQKEDPSLDVEHNSELKQIILHGQGDEHLAVVHHALENRFGLNIKFYDASIPYRETVTKTVRTRYKHKKQSGGAGQYAEVNLLIEPYDDNKPVPDDLKVRDVDEIDLPWGGKLVFQNCIVGGVIDNRFMPAILKGIMEKMESGPVTGCRARDIRVSVYDGSMHAVDSNEAAFKTAALMAFKSGFMDAAPKIMEPIYEIEVLVPDEYMGDVMSDMSSHRGQIQGMDAEGTLQMIRAHMPLAELDHYATRLKSMTQGRSTYTRKFSHYASVPHDIQQDLIEKGKEADAVTA